MEYDVRLSSDTQRVLTTICVIWYLFLKMHSVMIRAARVVGLTVPRVILCRMDEPRVNNLTLHEPFVGSSTSASPRGP